ncbi:MAG: DUF2461 domain-containing protein, partial [Gammaproteobacteria bacterium]|nr:DUF2461 domain-containing protein [Gammaproteobacteria bacterium]
YVHFEPGKIMIGGGVWMPPGPVLFKIRTAISEKPTEWNKISRNASFKKHFDEIKGDRLQRPPKGFDKTHPLIEELKRKSFFVLQEIDPALALTPKFISEVEKIFKASSPLMAFLTNAVELKFN